MLALVQKQHGGSLNRITGLLPPAVRERAHQHLLIKVNTVGSVTKYIYIYIYVILFIYHCYFILFLLYIYTIYIIYNFVRDDLSVSLTVKYSVESREYSDRNIPPNLQ